MNKILNSLQTKLTASFAILILVFFILTFFTTWRAAKNGLKEVTQAELLALSSLIAKTLSGVDAETMAILKPGDEASGTFIAMRDKLKSFQDAHSDIKYIYTMGKSTDGLVFMVDADYGNEEDPGAAIGEKYPEQVEKMFAAFQKPVVEDEFTTDKWGTLLSGYAPILDTKGAVVGIVGVDMASELVMEKQAFIGKSIYIVMAVSFIIAAAFIFLFSKTIIRDIRKLNQRAKDISQGNISIGVDVQRKDEIGELAESFGRMAESLKRSIRNITDLNETLESRVKERTKELEEANHELKLSEKILNETTEGVCITDLNGNLIRVNDAFCKIAGYAREELIGKNSRVLKSNKHDAMFYQNMWKEILSKGRWRGEVWNRKKNGEIYPKWLSINTIRNNAGAPTHYMGISSDISQMKQAEARVRRLAYYDSLTGLPNRVFFDEILERAILRSIKFGKIVVLMYLDLDRFKAINDALGQSMGDDVLIEVARRLTKIIKNVDTVARLGGDEFAIVLEEIDVTQKLTIIAERIIRNISRPLRIDGREISIGVSMGIAIAPNDDKTVEGLLMKADSAMYHSKDEGKGRYSFYSREIQERNRFFIDMENKIKSAIHDNEFHLLLQPKIFVSGGTKIISGAEALLRMAREGEPFITPDKFIKIAEDTGLIVPVGKWVIEEACRKVALLKKKKINIHIAVNVSVKQFDNYDIVGILKNALESNGLSPEDIEIEITESFFYKNADKIIDILNEIKKIGIKIGIDDFGTGYSSLNSLASLPIDYIKIDKTFVDKLGKPGEKELVSTIMSISRHLDLGAVIEGVEMKKQLDLLVEYSPISIQGYFFSKPLEFDAFLEFCHQF